MADKKFLIIHPQDNVGIALAPLQKGFYNGIKLVSDIPRGHKFALFDLKKGDKVIKYAEVIGIAKSKIKKGEHVHIHNLVSQRGKRNIKKKELLELVQKTKFPRRKKQKKEVENGKIKGFLRENGQVGIRNYIAVISTIVCANNVTRRIAEGFSDALPIEIPLGCGQLGEDHEQTVRTLVGLGKNPNVGAVLVVENGCQHVDADYVVAEILGTGKKVDKICIQSLGGTNNSIKKGREIVAGFAQKIVAQKRKTFSVSSLVVGVECGGSDFTSGLAANPVVGFVADKVLKVGGVVILSETTELIGAEHLLIKRMKNRHVAQKLIQTTTAIEERISGLGIDFLGSQPGPGNMQGGLSTVEEKSLGCISKAGRQGIFMDVLQYAQEIKTPGLVIMDTPGQDAMSNTGMVAGGAVIILFTTGRGTPLGAPLAPTIKITANLATYKTMKEDMDFYAGEVFAGKQTIEQAGERLYAKMLAVASGKQTQSEIYTNFEVAIYCIGVTS